MLNLITRLLNRPRFARVLAELAEPVAQRKMSAQPTFADYMAWEGFDR